MTWPSNLTGSCGRNEMAKPCTCGQCGPISHKIIKLSGPRTSTLYLTNPLQRTAQRWVVDGCQITAGRRCDWLVCVNDAHGTEEVFVELKGVDFHGAIEQLETTLNQLRCSNRAQHPRCLVALTRNPMAGTDVAREQVRFKNKYQARLLPLRDGSRHP